LQLTHPEVLFRIPASKSRIFEHFIWKLKRGAPSRGC